MHIYKDAATDIDVHSVTTILSMIDGESLAEFANFLGFKRLKLNDEMERYAHRGTQIHSILESYLDETKEEFKPLTWFDREMQTNIERKMQTVMAKFGKWKTIHTEIALACSELGYGGTIDCVAKINKTITVIDFKSSRQVRSKMLLQLGGYYNLLKAKTDLEVGAGMIILINENNCGTFTISKETLEEMGELFNLLATFYNKRINGSNYHKLKADEVKF